MHNANFVVVSRATIGMIALIVGFAAPPSLWAKGVLENPRKDSAQSGIDVISGWVCNARKVEIVIDEVATLQAAYGTERGDTVAECGNANNGFGLLLNWNLLGDGRHTIRVLADGVEFGHTAFTVTTLLGADYLRGANGSYRLSGFPWPGTDVVVRWEESLQNFVIESIEVHIPGVGVGAL